MVVVDVLGDERREGRCRAEKGKKVSEEQHYSPKRNGSNPTKQLVGCTFNKDSTSMDPEVKKELSSSSQKRQDDELECAKAEMGQVREENKRLKQYLDQITNDYKILQMQLYDTINQEGTKKGISCTTKSLPNNGHHRPIDEGDGTGEEPELVSLSLGRSSGEITKDGMIRTKPSSRERIDDRNCKGDDKERWSLRLDSMSKPPDDHDQWIKSLSRGNSLEETRDHDGWPPGKGVKRLQNNGGDDDDDHEVHVPQSNNPAPKKVRVSVRTRCDTPTMNDGCQWRKYGQKIAKGNPCPRAYYRCTVAPTCPVRKQVQRCPEDMSILITTYEGTHNHPLPLPATAMASTTSAAASMLLSTSASSATCQAGPHPSSTTTTIAANLHGLNLHLPSSSDPNSKLISQFHLHNNFLLHYSSPSSHPTITLDLASGHPPHYTSPSHLMDRFSLTCPQLIPKLDNCPTALSFPPPSEVSGQMPYYGNGILNYGSCTNTTATPQPDTRSYQLGTSSSTSARPDTIAVATKAITSDPNFQSALVAALSSIINASANQASINEDHNLGDHRLIPLVNNGNSSNSIYEDILKGKGCASSQPAGTKLLPTNKMSFSSPPDEKKDHSG